LLARNLSTSVSNPASDLSRLFHQLNNQLGIILANAELLENRLADEGHRARAGLVVTSVLEAIDTTHQLRQLTDPATNGT
jgi:hypothetical protein